MSEERQEFHVGVRTDDYATSIKAAKQIGGKEGEDVAIIREQVYMLMLEYPEGISQGQVRELCNKRYGVRSESSYRKRVPELAEIGLAERIGQVRKNAYGNSEMLWRAVPPGGKPSFSMKTKKKRVDKQASEIKRLRAALVEVWAATELEQAKAIVKKAFEVKVDV